MATTNVEVQNKRSAINSNFGPILERRTTVQVTTAGAATYTVEQVFGGRIERDPAGGNRTDVLPTITLIMAYLRGKAREVAVDLPAIVTFPFVIENTADAAETITLNVGTGGTIQTGHTMTIAEDYSKRFELTISTTSGSESYIVRNLGTYLT